MRHAAGPRKPESLRAGEARGVGGGRHKGA